MTNEELELAALEAELAALEAEEAKHLSLSLHLNLLLHLSLRKSVQLSRSPLLHPYLSLSLHPHPHPPVWQSVVLPVVAFLKTTLCLLAFVIGADDRQILSQRTCCSSPSF